MHHIYWNDILQLHKAPIFLLFQDAQLHHNTSDGVIFTNQSLVLQQIDRSRSGAYTCEAVNAVGKGSSLPIFLDVKCKFENNGFYPKISISFACTLCTTTTIGTQNLWPLLTGCRYLQVTLCYTNWKWDPKMVVAENKWSLTKVSVLKFSTTDIRK